MKSSKPPRHDTHPDRSSSSRALTITDIRRGARARLQEIEAELAALGPERERLEALDARIAELELERSELERVLYPGGRSE